MAFPLAAVIGGGASLVGQGINALTQGSTNRKNREFTERMFQKEKQSNIDMWNMQNTYNSPEQQVARLQKAGLSPTLAYGNGAVANSGSAPNSPHSLPYRAEAPKFDLQNPVDKYFDIATRQMQLSNDAKVGSNLDMQNQLLKGQATSQQLDNMLKAQGFDSNLRGLIGRNEMNYQGSIQKAVMSDLFNTLSGSNYTPTPHGMRVTNIDGTPNYLYNDWQNKRRSVELGNNLKRSADQGNKLQNQLKAKDLEFINRIKSGNLSDLGSADWLRLLFQGIGAFR